LSPPNPVEPEGKSSRRQLTGLEAWFRDGNEAMRPRRKMASLTWITVWLDPRSRNLVAFLSIVAATSANKIDDYTTASTARCL
jgi:antibiotic biosynthesis monooxygenase (ABM) superfamily enzyme